MEQEKSGFFYLPKPIKKCHHRDHNPPGHICIPQGKGYKHVCPACGQVTVMIPEQYSLTSERKLLERKLEIQVPLWVREHNQRFYNGY